MKQKTKGIICIICAAFFFALMGLFIRLAGDIPFFQKSFFRNIVAVTVSGVMLIKSKDKINIKKDSFGILMLRSFFGTIGIFCNFYAIDHMVLSDANMLNKLSPFFAILFALLFLREKADVIQVCSVIAAFIGALFIIKPTGNMNLLPAIVGISGGAAAGFAYTMVRLLGKKGVKGAFVIFFFSAFSCMASVPFIINNFTPMSIIQVVMLLGAGAAATGGQFSVTKAYYCAPAKEISIYDYSQIVFSALMSIFILGEYPDKISICGYFIIIAIAIAMYIYNMKKTEE